MFIPRLSRVAFWLAQELSRGKCPSQAISGYVQRPFSQFMQCQVGHRMENNMFHASIMQKNCLYSTTFSNDASGEEAEQKQKISVTFVDKDGEEKHIKVPIGMSMLEAAHENDIELEGACEGSLACSTCHVIVMNMEYYNKLEDPSDEENDMLDLAFGLTETSRLGCQVIAKPELEGIRLATPVATRNFAVDGCYRQEEARI